ncbi:hypothetical protein J7T55_003961 [Diaporthe amygdali]|uniref:uncharacterized protein n=1 Tax=Phomopsis amygdali TaxID=1214568 RepID=UPI0022FDB651|nr:uncharacterized protein J7T55_003961 [Diaporthe amygdali]KAJ0100753.1 hypothetical protein J7T55_003961 [Diaporthe amygdali]
MDTDSSKTSEDGLAISNQTLPGSDVSERLDTIIAKLNRLDANHMKQHCKMQDLITQIEALKLGESGIQGPIEYWKDQYNKAQEQITKLEDRYNEMIKRHFLMSVDLGNKEGIIQGLKKDIIDRSQVAHPREHHSQELYQVVVGKEGRVIDEQEWLELSSGLTADHYIAQFRDVCAYTTIQEEPGISCPLGEGKPALVDSVEDSILTIQDCLRQISNMAHQAFCATADHTCVPASYVRAWKDVYHKEAQKLREEIGKNKKLQALYEQALAETDHRKRDSAFFYCRMQELEEQVSEYAIRIEELEAGEQQVKTTQDRQLSDMTELSGDQIREEGEIVDIRSQNGSVLSNNNLPVSDVGKCDTRKRKASNGGEEDENAKETGSMEKIPRKKRRTNPGRTGNE